MIKSITISLTCDELSDIYMALNIVVSVFGKRDLVEIRNRIAKKLSECQDSNNIGGGNDHQV